MMMIISHDVIEFTLEQRRGMLKIKQLDFEEKAHKLSKRGFKRVLSNV
jgi:hypothetical protein